MNVAHSEAVMGTGVSFEVRNATGEVASSAIGRAVSWLHWVDRIFSPYRPDSEISCVGRGDLSVRRCRPEVRQILELCERLRDETAGFFDVWATGRLDPSGVVKGWSIEHCSEILTEAGCPDHFINGGGDVRVHGSAGPEMDWHVGVTHPFRLDAYCAALHLDDGAVATSGTYERGFHVIDPHRGRVATDLAAVTVIGPDLTMADAYATAALAMGAAAPAWLDGLAEHEALVIDSAGQGWETAGFDRYRLLIQPLRSG